MKFELIKNPKDMEMYGDIPCLPLEYTFDEGERFEGEESDAWLLLEYFVPEIDYIIENDLDFGDVDYFDKNKCEKIKEWIESKKGNSTQTRLVYLYNVLGKFIDEAIRLGTGVVIEL